MTQIEVSAFTFVHNALEGGYPIREAIQAVWRYVDEIIVVDMQSTDGTVDFINKNFPLIIDDPFGNAQVKIINGEWGNDAGETLRTAHTLGQKHCTHDILIHFEADEVYSDTLVMEMKRQIALRVPNDHNVDLSVWRLQVEQNFQRCRWYPEPVHRVFKKGSVQKDGHTTNIAHMLSDWTIVNPKHGFLWDCTNCFRDNWQGRIKNQTELWHNESQPLRRVPSHFMLDFDLSANGKIVEVVQLERFFQQPHWEWTVTPFDIPDVLKPLVGKVKYE